MNNQKRVFFVFTAILTLCLLAVKPVQGQQIFGQQRVISDTASGAYSVYAADLDGDNDQDVISANGLDKTVARYENNGDGAFSKGADIFTASKQVQAVYAADLDGDGDKDVLSASMDDTLAWYENDGAGNFGPQQVISNTTRGPLTIFAADLDGDGDQDVLSASNPDDEIVWYANDGSGAFGTEQVISTAADGPWEVYAKDLDGDGDHDVLSASSGDDKIAWYPNNGGSFGDQQIITTSADRAFSVFAADLDGDQIPDVLSASETDDKIAWYKNDGSGNFDPQKVISTTADAPSHVHAADLDGDSDKDVLSASSADNKIAWYANDGSGSFGAQQIISKKAGGAESINVADLNADGNLDVLSASFDDNKIAWYENSPWPEAPTDLVATPGNKRVKLTWVANSEADMAGYNIYRSTTGSVDTTSQKVNDALVTDTTFTDKNLTNKNTYYYAVSAVDTMGAQSESSTQVSARPAFFTKPTTGLPDLQNGDLAWGDYDGDGDLDVVLTGSNGNGPVAKIYRNEITGFTDISAGLTAVQNSSVAWGDFDNDGDLDLAIMGQSGASSITKIYENTSSGFTALDVSLMGLHSGDLAWADADTDGDLDLTVSGLNGGTPITHVYKNNDSTFTEAGFDLYGVFNSSIGWADYDNDSDMDLAIMGNDGSQRITRLYENADSTLTNVEANLPNVDSGDLAWYDVNGDQAPDLTISGSDGTPISKVLINTDNGFVDQQAGLKPLTDSSLRWGDLDNDGEIDLLINGFDGSSRQLKLYTLADGRFTEQKSINEGVSSKSTSLADYDGDGDLDIFTIGRNSSNNARTMAFANQTIKKNSSPGKPSNLNATIYKDDVVLNWKQAQDIESKAENLTYNIRIGSSPGAQDIYAAQSDLSTGFRRIPSAGNVLGDTSWTLKNMDPGTYYWSVQAVDDGLQGGDFAAEQQFTISEPFTAVGSGITGISQGALEWGDFDSDGDLDLAVAGTNSSGTPISRIYENTSNGLTAISAGLPGFQNSALSWGDYDNDGDLDLAIAGENSSGTEVTEIYRNDAGSFNAIGAAITGVTNGSLDWGDYDNDGDLDLSISGTNSGSGFTNIFKNQDSTFTAVDPSFRSYRGSLAWGDYDNDGDLDLLFSGQNGSKTRVTKIFENTSHGFSDTGAGIEGISNSSVAWADYDSDGDLDFAIAGSGANGPVGRIYRNSGGTFANISAGIQAGPNSGLSWGDYDNDGKLDLIVIDTNAGSQVATRIYENRGSDDFAALSSGIELLGASSLAMGDYDNDSDLDLAVAGSDSSGTNVTDIFTNNITTQNTKPSPPSDLQANVITEDVTLEWSPGDDQETPIDGLTYNVRIGTSSMEGEVLSAHSDSSNGYRRVVRMGNANSNTSWKIDSLQQGKKYYWSVQTIDGARAGSDFAVEDSFRVTERFTDTNSIFTPLNNSDAAWGNYNNDDDLDFVITGEVSGEARTILYRNENGEFKAADAQSLEDVHSGSVNWHDFDADGDLDLLLTGINNSDTPVTVLYENTESGFTAVSDTVFTGVYNSDAAWGDYDNDGDQDLIVIGNDGSSPVTKIYEQLSGRFVEDSNVSLPAVQSGEVAWADYDNDQDFDLAITGSGITRIYQNSGGTFSPLDAGFTRLSNAALAWGDLGNDGDLDLAVLGEDANQNPVSKVYEFDNGGFQEVEMGLSDVRFGSLEWGDYDNDGDSDLLLSGRNGTQNYTKVYDQVSGSLVDSPIDLQPLSNGNAIWGDFDGDQTLDILVSGSSGSGSFTKLYENKISAVNQRPQPPTDLVSSVNGTEISLQWNAAGDDNTPESGLTYNVKIGTSSGEDDIMSINAELSGGQLKTVSKGNVGHKNSWKLQNLADGTYYWSVQAIDGAYRGGTFSSEHTFTVNEKFVNSNISLPPLQRSSVAWADYDDDGDLDLAISGYDGTENVNRIYENTSDGFSVGTSLGSLQQTSMAWADYDNDGDLDLTISGSNAGTEVTEIYENTSSGFNALESPVAQIARGDIAWGDYDNDGDLDLAVSGINSNSEESTIVFENTSSGFSEVDAGIADVRDSSLEWGDYDNDGDLDLALAGYNGSQNITRVYENRSAGFEVVEAGLPGIYNGDIAWGDYDNDGDLDLALTGNTGSEAITKIFRNTSDGFVAQDLNLPAVWNSSLSWADYDNDGDLDLTIAGFHSTAARSTYIYENTSNGFKDIQAGLTGIDKGSIAWGDYDNDGDQDLAVTGNLNTKIYDNRLLDKKFTPANTAPDIPQNTDVEVTDGTVLLSWQASDDPETPSKALSYNLRIGRTKSGLEVASPQADTSTGTRKIVRLGNAQLGTSHRIQELPAGTYYWNVQAIDGGWSAGSFTETDSFRVATLPPPAKLTGSTTNGEISLAWASINDPGLSGYYVYRQTSAIDSLSDFNTKEPIDTLDSSASSYADQSVQNGQRYYYRITAVDTSGGRSSFSSQVSLIAGAPASPQDLAVEPGDSSVTISWTANTESDLKAYHLFRHTNPIDVELGSLTPVDTVSNSETSLKDSTLSNGTRYYYRIVAVDDDNLQSRPSEQVSAVPRDQQPPAVPVSVMATAGDGIINLQWNANNEADLDLYEIYRDTVEIESGTYPGSDKIIHTVKSPDSSFTDASVKGGQEYYYRITAVDTTQRRSGLSAQVSSIPKLQKPTPPDSIRAVPGDKQITLKWSVNPELDVSTYNIYRSTTEIDSLGLPDDTLATVQSPDTSLVSFVDQPLQANQTYYYRITAVDNSDLESGSSVQISEVPVLLPPDPPRDVLATGLESKVKLRWTPNEQKDLDLYAIYRNTTPIDTTDDRSTLTELESYPAEMDSTFMDTSAVNGQTYYYRMVAIDSDSLISSFSSQATAQPQNLSPAPPQNLVAKRGGANIRLSWNQNTETDLAYYKIYRQTTSIDSLADFGNVNLIDSVTVRDTTYIDESVSSNQTYFYRITAQDQTGLQSGFSGQDTVTTRQLFVKANASLPGLNASDMAWADFDDDGDYDLAYMGNNGSTRIARIYENTGNNFSDVNAGLVGSDRGSLDWADFDNDGDLDFALTGMGTNGPVTKIYENDESGFSELTSLKGAEFSSLSWGDFDNDGDQDLAVMGADGGANHTIIYTNHNSNFSELGADLQGLSAGDLAWVDIDNDGDLDLAICGLSEEGTTMTKIYENESDTFTELNTNIIGVTEGDMDWGDFDADGDLDLAITGITDDAQHISKVYRNNENGFEELGTSMIGVDESSTEWVDYNLDGDLDLVIGGRTENDTPIIRFYENTGGKLTYLGVNLPGLRKGAIATGFFDSDSKKDFMVSGVNKNNNRRWSIYLNQAGNLPPKTQNTIVNATPASGSIISGTSGTKFNISFDTPLRPKTITPRTVKITGSQSSGNIPFRYELSNNNKEITLTSRGTFYATEDVTLKLNSGANGVQNTMNQFLDGNNDGAYNGVDTDNVFYNFTVTALADFDQDSTVDFNDLTAFREAWTNQDYSNELGPTIGSFPAVKVQPDSTFNVRDLVTFIRFWNWSMEGKKKQKPKRFAGSENVSAKELQKNGGAKNVPNIGNKGKASAGDNFNRSRIRQKELLKANHGDENNIPTAIASDLKAKSASSLKYLNFEKVDDKDRYQGQQKSNHTTTYRVNVNYPDSLSAMKVVVEYDPRQMTLQNIKEHNFFNKVEGGKTVFLSHVDSLKGVAIINTANFGKLGKVSENTSLASLRFKKRSKNVGQVRVGYDIRNGANNSNKAWSKINVDLGGEVPQQFVLENNYPNPFNPSTVIQYQIPKQSNIKLVVYDVIGRRVATLVDEQVEAGFYKIRWNAAKHLASGVYFYVLNAEVSNGDDFREVKKMLLIK